MSQPCLSLAEITALTSLPHPHPLSPPYPTLPLPPHHTTPYWVLQQKSWTHSLGENWPSVWERWLHLSLQACPSPGQHTRVAPVVWDIGELTLRVGEQGIDPVLPCLLCGGMGEKKVPSPPHPLPSAVGESTVLGIARGRELALTVTGCSTQECRPCTPSGQHTRADPV